MHEVNDCLKTTTPLRRCAIYTRKSTEEGLEQEFNSLDAQREACEAYIHSQRHEGWQLHPDQYDDGGFSGGNIDRPALSRLMEDLKAGLIDIIVVYKIDRLSRSLSDFVRMVELFDQHQVSFVSVTQQFNTSTSMGRLTLNVLLSFAQFEREITSERIRDKLAASAKKGLWMGGTVPLGYDAIDKKLVINTSEADTVRHIYERYLALKCVRKLKAELDTDGYISKQRKSKSGARGGQSFYRGALYTILKNPIYIGKVRHHKNIYQGQQDPIIDSITWKRVQKQLEDNRSSNKRRTTTKQPSLLAGLIYDDRGNVMSPSHSNKNQTRRYRYYVSQAVLRYQDKEVGSVSRIAAHEIEELVSQQLVLLLQDGSKLLDITATYAIDLPKRTSIIERGRLLAEKWQSQSPHQQLVTVSTTLKKVTVGRERVCLIFSRTGLLALISADISTITDESDEIEINLNVKMQRCGIESKLIIEGQGPGSAHKRTVHAIQEALSKAMKWNQALISGEVATMKALAEKEGVAQRYLALLIKLAWLSPEIMQAIIRGQIPATLSLDKLKKGFSLDWHEQWQDLGFATLPSKPKAN